MDICSIKHFIDNDDVDLFQRIRTSNLFSIMQQAVSIHHIDQGVAHSATIDRGFLWIITSQYAEIDRMPSYGETITIETWCGNQAHVLFPRYFRIIDEQNNVIIRSSSIWTIMNASTRKLALPAEHGINIPGIVTGNEIPLPQTPVIRDTEHVRDFVVPYSYLDLNGHMNNTKYFDVAQDSISAPIEGKHLKELSIEYRNECRYGETLHISENHIDGDYLIIGKSEKEVFRISMKYDEK